MEHRAFPHKVMQRRQSQPHKLSTRDKINRDMVTPTRLWNRTRFGEINFELCNKLRWYSATINSHLVTLLWFYSLCRRRADCCLNFQMKFFWRQPISSKAKLEGDSVVGQCLIKPKALFDSSKSTPQLKTNFLKLSQVETAKSLTNWDLFVLNILPTSKYPHENMQMRGRRIRSGIAP